MSLRLDLVVLAILKAEKKKKLNVDRRMRCAMAWRPGTGRRGGRVGAVRAM